MREIYEDIIQRLKDERLVATHLQGKSMQTMLFPNRDKVILRKIQDNDVIRENDVILYNKKDKLVLHRVIKVLSSSYVLLGDNCSAKEYDIKREQVLGILIGFLNEGTYYSINNPRYLSYVSRLRKHQSIRIVKKRIYDILSQFMTSKKIKKNMQSLLHNQERF